MSELQNVLEEAQEQLSQAGVTDIDTELLEAVTKGLGPAIYNADASLVSSSDKEELDRVRESFLKEKLGVDASDEECDAAIAEVMETLGSDNRRKMRVVVYYLLTKKFGKESVYNA